MPDAVDPDTASTKITIDHKSIISLDIARSDSRVANIFWVPPGASMIDTNGVLVTASLANGNMLDFDHINNNPVIYGNKMMEVATSLVGTGMPTVPNALEVGPRTQAQSEIQTWFVQRRNELRDLNRDNSVFDEGMALIKGDERAKPSHYMTIRRHDRSYEFYCNRVSHNITPLRDWQTSLGLVRGRCFLDRLGMTAPYYTEGRDGPYRY